MVLLHNDMKQRFLIMKPHNFDMKELLNRNYAENVIIKKPFIVIKKEKKEGKIY